MCRNPFPAPSPLDRVLLGELAKVARLCYQRGWSYGTAGNFSLRGSGGLIWQSPSGLHKGSLNPQSFVPVDLALGDQVSPQGAKPSLEMPIHLAVYRALPVAKSVVHAHPPAFVMASRHRKALRFQGEEMQKALGIPDHCYEILIDILPNPLVSEVAMLANQLQSVISERLPLVALSGHGIYAWGSTPLEAFVRIEALEFLCKTAVN